MLADFARAEAEEPSPRKDIDGLRTIIISRRFNRPAAGKSYGLPVLCDFGEARIGKTHESGPFVQPQIYRAPEIIFEMPWGRAADIWNLAALVRTRLAMFYIVELTECRSGTSLKENISLGVYLSPRGAMTRSSTSPS